MAGGMTHSEIRECYALAGALNKDIYIGAAETRSGFPITDKTGGNNQDQRIRPLLCNLLMISKFWNWVVLDPVQHPTEFLRVLPTNPIKTTMIRNSLPLTRLPHSARHLLYQRILVRLFVVESSLNPARAPQMPPAPSTAQQGL